jgi:2-(1,2-epoxy-1,2-dihydrophenyl)acetyl-CoA isomerase
MKYAYIQFNEEHGIATLTLNRPEVLNALNVDMAAEMNDALDRLRDLRTARVLVLTGAGRAFSSGADLAQELPDDCGATLETHLNPLVARLAELPCPVIASVNGPAAGAGGSIALLSDLVLASRSAYFMLAFINIGLVPDSGATWVLPRLIGTARATEMMMLGERVPAEQAERWGMIHKCVDDAELASATRALAERLANGPTRAYAMVRHGIRYGLEHSLMDTVHLERRHQLLAGRTRDLQEGVEAFRAKRKARFAGE